MTCHVCGSDMRPTVTDMPFKTGDTSIVIVKGLPVLQCENCTEFLIEDPIMKHVDAILDKADTSVELEIVRFAA